MAAKSLCCPKCGGRTYTLGLVIEEGEDWDVENGKVKFAAQSAMPNPIRGWGNCKAEGCGHQWRLRRASLTNLPERT